MTNILEDRTSEEPFTNVEDERSAHKNEAKRRALKQSRVSLAESIVWVVASVIGLWVYAAKWHPQSDWTVAIKWIVLLSILTNLIYSINSLIRATAYYGEDNRY